MGDKFLSVKYSVYLMKKQQGRKFVRWKSGQLTLDSHNGLEPFRGTSCGQLRALQVALSLFEVRNAA